MPKSTVHRRNRSQIYMSPITGRNDFFRKDDLAINDYSISGAYG
jgi:hypothetical protein